jgi:hypothetical protein
MFFGGSHTHTGPSSEIRIPGLIESGAKTFGMHSRGENECKVCVGLALHKMDAEAKKSREPLTRSLVEAPYHSFTQNLAENSLMLAARAKKDKLCFLYGARRFEQADFIPDWLRAQ